MERTDHLPVVDVGALADPDASTADRTRVATELGDACRDVGFFYVRNHGVPQAHRDGIFEQIARFFDLPTEKKMELFIGKSEHFSGYVPLGWEETAGLKDWHEGLDFRPPFPRNGTDSTLEAISLRDSIEWPIDPPGFQEALKTHWDQMVQLGAQIARGIALSLGLNDSFLASFTRNPFCTMRVLHYPAHDGNRQGVGEGIGPHIDYGFLTILDQEGVSGLEVMNTTGDWIPVPSVPGSYIVNIGRVMQIWSNDRYLATQHRVRGVRGDRYSLPFFYNPTFDAVIEPLPAFCSAENPPRYEPYCHGEFMAERLRTAFKTSPADLAT